MQGLLGYRLGNRLGRQSFMSLPGEDEETRRNMEIWGALPDKVRAATPPPLPDPMQLPLSGVNPAASRPMENWGGDGRRDKPKRPPGFWAGGDKFTGRDAIAGVLAAVGDAFAAQNDQRGYGVEGLLGGRLDARKLAQERADKQAELDAENQQRSTIAQQLMRQGVAPDEAWTLSGDPTSVRNILGQRYDVPSEVRTANYVAANPNAASNLSNYLDMTKPILQADYTGAQHGVRRSDVFGQSAAPSEAHIRALMENPDKAEEFDRKFGEGASSRYLGGPTGTRSGPFRY